MILAAARNGVRHCGHERIDQPEIHVVGWVPITEQQNASLGDVGAVTVHFFNVHDSSSRHTLQVTSATQNNTQHATRNNIHAHTVSHTPGWPAHPATAL